MAFLVLLPQRFWLCGLLLWWSLSLPSSHCWGGPKTRRMTTKTMIRSNSSSRSTNPISTGRFSTSLFLLSNAAAAQKETFRSKPRRNLQVTGDVWLACSSNNTEGQRSVDQNHTNYTKAVYQLVDYDDQALLDDDTNSTNSTQPVCTCLWNDLASQYWMQCSLGDETCQQQDDTDKQACTTTQESFLFSTRTGNLEQKSTCQVCASNSSANNDNKYCTGIEACTVVVFDVDYGTPERCVVQQTELGTPTQVCDQCTICRDDNGKYGVAYDCFGTSTPKGQCDTSHTTAVVNNFVPTWEYLQGRSRIGGTFGRLCQNQNNDAILAALYGGPAVTYDDDYQKICRCKDPTRGIIACDLFRTADTGTFDCFGTECSEISEVFTFATANGELYEKITCDSNRDVCSIVTFSSTTTSEDDDDGNAVWTGDPLDCSIFLMPAEHPIDAVVGHNRIHNRGPTCDDCRICRDEATQATGIQFDCFGNVTDHSCQTNYGRTVFNIQGKAPKSGGSSSKVNRASGATIGIVVASLLIVVAAVLMVKRKNRKRTKKSSPVEEEPPVDFDVGPAASVAESEETHWNEEEPPVN